jgi:dihydropteroate synthase
MREAVAAGATMINDVRALREPGAMQAAAESQVAICLMHMLGEPRSMQESPRYENVVEDVYGFLQQRVMACREAGIDEERIVVDPGFGFGKTLDQNLALLDGLDRLAALNRPLMVGLSRKSMLGLILDGADVTQRLYASIAGAVLSARNGASILRVHDVRPTIEALSLVDALRGVGKQR